MLPYKSVLAVDDDPAALSIYRAYFGSLGVQRYLEATSGMHALQVMRQAEEPVDLIQIDVYMPEMDGIELLRELHLMDFAGAVVIASGARPFDRSSAINLASTYQFNILGEVKKPLTRARLDAVYRPDASIGGNTPYHPAASPAAS
ncbi:MAG: response regulator [Pseudomonadota bacterium]